MDARKQDEIQFANQRMRDLAVLGREKFEQKYSNGKFYVIERQSEGYIDRWLKEHCPSKTVLDYCCGCGVMSKRIASFGANVHGIDISNESIETSRTMLQECGYQEQTSFQVMDAEKMTFPDSSFDVVVCSGVLHHLDVRAAFPEIARVLKPGGRVLAMEALGYNPAICLYRKLTPHLRTAWEKDHILTLRELRLAKQHFGKIRVRYYHLFTILAVPFRKFPVFSRFLGLLEAIDSIVLRVPFIQLMAWQMVFELSQPIKQPRQSQ